MNQHQPPSGGCVLKRRQAVGRREDFSQPPSGGCVLKRLHRYTGCDVPVQPPSGGCVLKQHLLRICRRFEVPAAFRRLCVETTVIYNLAITYPTSRLQAAVC